MKRNNLLGWLLATTLATVVGLGIFGNHIWAHASTEPCYVIKSAQVKMYRHPRALKPQAKYMGTTAVYQHTVVYINHQIKVHGKAYVKVIKPLNSNNFHHIKKVTASEAGIEGYFPKSNLKRVKPIRQTTKMARTAFHIVNAHFDFWDIIPSTDSGEADTVFRGDNYRRQTLYVTQQKVTHNRQKYDFVRTKTGHQLGWLNARALQKGGYQQPTVVLTQGLTDAKVQVWHNPIKKQAAVAIVTKNSQVTQIIAQNQDVNSLIIQFKQGQPVRFKKVLYNGRQVTVKRVHTFKYDSQRQQSTITVEDDQRIGKRSAKTYQTIYSTLKISQSGEIQQVIQKKDQWLLDTEKPSA